jgi:hypothetical protein
MTRGDGTIRAMERAHTAAAAALVAGVVLVPLGFWLYAQAASVDKGSQVAHAKRLLLDVAPPVPGARSLGLNVYVRRDWEGESLVPIKSYTVETAYSLPRPMRPAQIVAHYKRHLAGWRMSADPATGIRFVRGDDEIGLDIVEYREKAPNMRSYGVIVSQ